MDMNHSKIFEGRKDFVVNTLKIACMFLFAKFVLILYLIYLIYS